MSASHDDAPDRAAILARRAVLLGTALAAVHCGGPSGSTSPPDASTTATEPTSTSTSTATTTSTNRPAPKAVPWADVMRDAPPRGIPSSLSEAERQQLKYLEDSLDARYEAIRAVWEKHPDCDAANPDCKPAWRELGAAAKAMFDATRGPMVFPCGPPPGVTASVSARKAAHAKFIGKLVERVEAHFDGVAASYSPQGEQEWRRIAANAKKPPPMPCLSPCPMPDVTMNTRSIPFDKDARDLTESMKDTIDATVTEMKGNRKPAKIVVRGHADAGESNPAELSLARAKAIAAKLVAGGIAKDRVEVKGLGADVPIEQNKTDAGAASNRRVDFEVVPL